MECVSSLARKQRTEKEMPLVDDLLLLMSAPQQTVAVEQGLI
jgi:hypothetical protein